MAMGGLHLSNAEKPSVRRNRVQVVLSVLSGSIGLAFGLFMVLVMVVAFVVNDNNAIQSYIFGHLFLVILLFSIVCFPLASRLMTGQWLGFLYAPAAEVKRILCDRCGQEFPISYEQSRRWRSFLLRCPHCGNAPHFAGQTHKTLWIIFIILFLLGPLIAGMFMHRK